MMKEKLIMQTTISAKEGARYTLAKTILNPEAQALLMQLRSVMSAKHYATRSIGNYMREMRLLFSYYNDIDPRRIKTQDIIDYIQYIKSVYKVGREKCHQVAQSCSFFYKHVIPSSFIVPSSFYPRKECKLPTLLSEEEVKKLISSVDHPKHKMMISLFYGTGLRMNELRLLEPHHIDSKLYQIKVMNGKGARERYTILPKALLEPLREYYKRYRPKKYLFEGQKVGYPMHERSIQHFIHEAIKRLGWDGRDISAHTLRHSFATHMLDHGTDIHSIKTLLGHSKLETTMVYLHLSKTKRLLLVSPFDRISTDVQHR